MPVKVSVVMPVYNGEQFLGQAVESILNQTFDDFELIIINDGSSDNSAAIIREYQQQDARIVVHQHEKNMGLVAAMNNGYRLAQGRYIAVMHSDDMSLPNRLEKQVDFLDNHTEVGVLGSNIQIMNEGGEFLQRTNFPVLPGHLSWELLFNNPLAHPAVMLRASVLTAFAPIGYYKSERFPAEDYDLWSRLDKVTRLANLPDVLLHYRIWSKSVTGRFHSREEIQATIIAQDNLKNLLGEDLSSEMIEYLRSTFGAGLGKNPSHPNDIRDVAKLLKRSLNVFKQQHAPFTREENSAIAYTFSMQFYRLAGRALRAAPLDAFRYVVSGIAGSPSSVKLAAEKYLRKFTRSTSL